MTVGNTRNTLTPHLTGLETWAFSLGTAVGWGSLVVTSNTYLADAGPLGSVLGLIFGALIMLVISRNYAYLMQIHPDCGGVYTYSKEVYGYDHGFLTGWFLSLVYLAILWANATSIPLFTRYFLGGVFQFGKMYTIFGYDVYIGESLLTIAVMLLVGVVCLRSRRVAARVMTALAIVFAAGITAVFVCALFGQGSKGFSPAFVPDTGALRQIIGITVISPWAFIGFESISHRAEEFTFHRTKIFRVLVISVISTVLLYIFVTLLSVTAYPERYDSWLAYIRDLKNLEGLEALPAFYAAHHFLGNAGVGILMASLLALVITSLIGNTTALSRLLYSLGKDKVLPEKFGTLNDRGVPQRAIGLIAILTILITFVGRTAIGWIVDVTTIGATLIYSYVSAAAMKTAKLRRDRTEYATGIAGLLVMIGFALYLLLPSLVSGGSIERETYFLFVAWCLLGFLFFRNLLHRDQERRFGTSIVVWIALLSLVLFVALIWMRQSMIASNARFSENIQTYFEQMGRENIQSLEDELFVRGQMDQLESENLRAMFIAFGMFGFALVIMLTNHIYMNRRSRENEILANVDPMTGVKSKHAWMMREREINHALEKGNAPEFAVMVCDVNGLKQINDTQGHKAGDEYICNACHMICEIFTHSPVYRIGGDEFAILLTGRDYEARSELAQMLHSRSVTHINEGGAVVSGGLAEYQNGQDSNLHMVFERADHEMYAEKALLKGLGAVTREEPKKDEAPQEALEQASVLTIRKQILIAEDVAINQLMLGEILQEGYDVLYASDGMECLDLVREHRDSLALVLLDLQMPRMSGLEVLRVMNADQAMRKIPVIVLTADETAEVECLEAGAMDFIPKPYPGAEIIRARVSKCIELSENRDIIQSTERDPLTTLYNIEFFLRYVNLYDKRYPDQAMDAMVMDINHFHMVNERYGKAYGDQMLQLVGQRVRLLSREVGGVGCRRSGDTFLLYCPHREDYGDLLEKVSAGIHPTEGNANRVWMRMGVYSDADKSLDLERRFDRAKMAADSVRNSRVQSVGVYNAEMHAAELHRDRLMEDFPTALKEEQLKVYFQPKYDIRPDKPVLSSAEALVRWIHPELGMISPGVFIPMLEDSGLIFNLDAYVWRKTAAQIRQWKDECGFSVPVSVNVSRIDMLMPNLRDTFQDILNEYQLTTADIILEITESAYAGDSEQVLSTARDLRGMGMGFRIEMDDFGTGYSSLGALNHLPIDALKLDMSFVRNAFSEKKDLRMIELILDIARYLQVPVIAEGVETEEQYLGLKELGVDYVQGYYFSKPVPSETFQVFFRN